LEASSALELILTGDATLFAIVRLSLLVTLSATFFAALIGLPLGAIVANIENFTRVMTTTIALETSKGNLPLAIGLGMVLITLIIFVNALAWAVRRWSEAHAG